MDEKLSYQDIFEYDIELYNFIKNKYGTDDKAWKLFVASYIDPDGYSGKGIKNDKKIKLTSDGLLSIKRIKNQEGFGVQFIDTFTKYRKNPIFYFPCEDGGINQLRARLLEDRIDHTLLDIKHYLEGKSDYILKEAYSKPKTKEWLNCYMNDFNAFVLDTGISEVFVNEHNEIYDLEKSGGALLKELKNEYVKPRCKNYLAQWNSNYYSNVKARIKKYMDKNMECKGILLN